MSNKTYDILKYIALIVLPAAAVFYSTIAKIWNLPFENAIPDTIMAIDLFLGAILKISSDDYAIERIGAERTDVDRRDDSEVDHAEDQL